MGFGSGLEQVRQASGFDLLMAGLSKSPLPSLRAYVFV